METEPQAGVAWMLGAACSRLPAGSPAARSASGWRLAPLWPLAIHFTCKTARQCSVPYLQQFDQPLPQSLEGILNSASVQPPSHANQVRPLLPPKQILDLNVSYLTRDRQSLNGTP